MISKAGERYNGIGAQTGFNIGSTDFYENNIKKLNKIISG